MNKIQKKYNASDFIYKNDTLFHPKLVSQKGIDLVENIKKVDMCSGKYFVFKTKSGNIIAKGIWKLEFFEGPYTEYYSNGKIKCEGQFKNGELKNDTWKYYSKKGKLVKQEIFYNGNIISN